MRFLGFLGGHDTVPKGFIRGVGCRPESRKKKVEKVEEKG